MSKEPKQDFRKTLNYMLGLYYAENGVFVIHRYAQENNLNISFDELMAGFNTLLSDGYVVEVMPSYSSVPVGAITGEGRIFHEAGGYKDETTKFDKIVKWAKNNIIVALIIVIFICLTSIAGIASLILEFIKIK